VTLSTIQAGGNLTASTKPKSQPTGWLFCFLKHLYTGMRPTGRFPPKQKPFDYNGRQACLKTKPIGVLLSVRSPSSLKA
jgi:hypothetical protein